MYAAWDNGEDIIDLYFWDIDLHELSSQENNADREPASKFF